MLILLRRDLQASLTSPQFATLVISTVDDAYLVNVAFSV